MEGRRQSTKHSFKWILACITAGVVLMTLTSIQLRRLEEGRLFALTLPWERVPSPVEEMDAEQSARTYRRPAVVFFALCATIMAIATPTLRVHFDRRVLPSRIVVALFLIAAFGDLVTTIWFFHVQGIEHELHPGIRLFGYAYGRTVGPLTGKTIQAIGILSVAALASRWGNALIITATILYAVAAAYNLSQLV